MPDEIATERPKAMRGWKGWLRWLATRALVLYVLYTAGMSVVQEWFIFPRGVPGARDAADPVPKGWEQLTVVDGGVTVPAWLHMPDTVPGAAEKSGVVMFFHGNAEIIDDLANPQFSDLFDDAGVRMGVLLVEYRGYGRAGGKPSESGLVADGVKFHDMLTARADVDPAKIVYYGRSLGGGVACGVATQRAPAAMVLQSTFTSVRALAKRLLLPGFLVRHPFLNDEIIPTLDLPILFLHGSQDTIIPCSHSEKLLALARHGKMTTQECDHNDFPVNWTAYRNDVHKFLRECGVSR